MRKAKIARSNAIGMGLIDSSDKLEDARQEIERDKLLLADEENIAQVPNICYLVKDSKDFLILRESNKAQLAKVKAEVEKMENPYWMPSELVEHEGYAGSHTEFSKATGKLISR